MLTWRRLHASYGELHPPVTLPHQKASARVPALKQNTPDPLGAEGT